MIQLPELTTLAVFTFGALTFSLLTVFYWVERRRRKGTVFPLFTLVCAAAFLSSLLGAVLVRHVAAGLLPPLLLHLVYEVESPGLGRRRVWRAMLAVLYGGSLISGLAVGLNESAVASMPWADLLYRAPGGALAAAALLGMALQVFSRRTVEGRESAYHWWIRALLLTMLVCAGANLGGFGYLVGQAPDYLLLAFFCVTLYYRERLVFFDVLMKRGVFLAIGLTVLTLSLSYLSANWTPWIYVLGLLLFWLAAPLVYDRVARAVDLAWLRRPYSPVEAERQFILATQSCTTEEELGERAARSLETIFHAPVTVRFDGAPAASEDGIAAEMEHGGIALGARSNGVPLLSDDRRLLQTLAGALGVVLENVRFRAERRRQEEREQHLRWLASRAELKALRAQINPHFLFNALSVIAGLIPSQPELADETIEKLGEVFRYTLRKSEKEWTPLGEEVGFVAAYLGIEQARFGERLQVEFAVDPAAARVPVPAMTIQPLIENAVKHGISAVEGRGVVRLRVALDGGCLRVEVFDNGPGFPPGFSLDEGGEGHGLRNVAERLRGYYGDAAPLSWESGADGTRVVLTLPQAERTSACAS